jgi:hypothetical protein
MFGRLARRVLVVTLLVLVCSTASAEGWLPRAASKRVVRPTQPAIHYHGRHDYYYHRHVPPQYWQDWYPKYYGGFHARALQIYAYPSGQWGLRGAPW